MPYFSVSAKTIQISIVKRTVVVSVILYTAHKLLNVSSFILNYESVIKSGIEDTVICNKQTQQQCNTMNSICELPHDLIKHIVSYVPYLPSIKLINKCFNESSKRNIQIELIRANKLITKENHFISIPDNRFDGKIWIIDPNKQTLTEREANMGFKGPLNHVVCAMIECSDGDRVFVSEGIYEFDEFLVWTQPKSIMFIGIGNVTIKNIPHPFLLNKHFENIQFVFERNFDNTYQDIFVAELSLKQCTWNVTQSIHCGGNVHFEDCVFIQSEGNFDYLYAGFMSITPWCNNAVIIGCKFSKFRYYSFLNRADACIYISQNNLRYVAQYERRHREDRSNMKLIIVGNTFESNKNYPIVFETDYSRDESYKLFINSDRCLIKHNILKGVNILESNTNEYINPNKIYREYDYELDMTQTPYTDSCMCAYLFQCLDDVVMSVTHRLLRTKCFTVCATLYLISYFCY